MATYRSRRIFPVILVIIIIAIAIVGLVYVIQILFFSGGGNISLQADTSRSSLINTSADRAVSVSVRGHIIADEDFRSYQIRVTPNERVFTTYRGYQKDTIENDTLENNIPAYEQFVYALSRAGLMNSSAFTGVANDTRGICAAGFLYEFQIYQADKSLKMLWTTSCSASRGSLGQGAKALESLFIEQIPDAQKKIGRLWG